MGLGTGTGHVYNVVFGQTDNECGRHFGFGSVAKALYSVTNYTLCCVYLGDYDDNDDYGDSNHYNDGDPEKGE